MKEEVKLQESGGINRNSRHGGRVIIVDYLVATSNKVVVSASEKVMNGVLNYRKLGAIDISNYCSATGVMVEGGPSDRDISSLRRELDKVGERIEEVAELAILNE